MSAAPGAAGGAPDAPGVPGTAEAAARRLADVFALSGVALRGLVRVPPVTGRDGRVILVATLERGLLRSAFVRGAVGARARRRASREGAGAA